jgi:hypothetical protein
MNEELKNRLDEQDKLLVEMYNSIESARKFFKWTFIITAAAIVLPLIGMMFALPSFLGSMSSGLGGF